MLDNPESLSVQFYITGDNEQEHATFDAVPQDEVADSWNTTTTLQNYAEEIDVSTEDDPVDPDEFPVTFTITDATGIYEAIEFKGEITSWSNVPMTEGPDHVWTLTLETFPGTYQWGAIENDGSEHGIWLIPEGNLTVTVDAEGNVSGQNTYTIEEEIVDDPVIGWANLQWPPSGSAGPGGEYLVFARVYVEELTGSEATPESLSDLQAWVGYSTQDATQTSDFENGWTWVEASLPTTSRLLATTASMWQT